MKYLQMPAKHWCIVSSHVLQLNVEDKIAGCSL